MSEEHSLCHLTEGRCRGAKRARRKRFSFKRKLLSCVFLLLALALLTNFRLAPIFTELARAEVERTTEALLAEAITDSLTNAAIPYRDIVTLTYKSDGSVAAMQTDTAILLDLRTTLVRAALSSMLAAESIPLKIPLASVLGLNFAPSAPAFSVKMHLSRNVNAYFLSTFEECGINQTRHSIVFRLSIEVYLLIPSRARHITVMRDFPLTETVIVGNVPDAYTQIHRLTDDITEEELDDIYDFGAGN